MELDAAEHGVDGIGIVGTGLARSQPGFGGGQRFFALRKEDGLDFLGVHAAPPTAGRAAKASTPESSFVGQPGQGCCIAQRGRWVDQARPSPVWRGADQQLQHRLADMFALPRVDAQRAGAKRRDEFGQQRLGGGTIATGRQDDRRHGAVALRKEWSGCRTAPPGRAGRGQPAVIGRFRERRQRSYFAAPMV